ncbi:DUF6153 family protein [Agrococcus sp. DT81.2]|uniref:DUF6153 family protein n=1 Tax=Agrococcus sp. DT81.2 TaxID=3393414 RepID=UPI003CE48A2B
MLLATVTLLIAGLLGMHALSGSGGHASGHGGAALAADSHHGTIPVSPHAHDEQAASPSKTASCSIACDHDAPAAPGHADVVACVLALLAGLIVLVPPARLGRSWAQTAVPRGPAVASAVLLAPPPPSLTLLSISRT